MSQQRGDAIIWIDLETTGLNPETDHILEVACIITDSNLNELETFVAVVHEPDEVLEKMNDWCKKQHGKTGLTQKSRESTQKLEQVELGILLALEKWVIKGTAPLGGSSVHFDRKFVEKYMKKFSAYVHYRNIDVSTVMELCKRWCPLAVPSFGPAPHRALEDIRGSIKQLEFYRKLLFDKKQEQHIHVHVKRQRTEGEEEESVSTVILQ